MKKIILTTLLSIFGTIVSIVPVFGATTVSLSPMNINISEGQNFNVSIAIDSQNIKSYAEKIVLSYPADLLKVNSFTFNDTWIPLTQPGYDLIDNTNGTLIKGAGYPGGFSSKTNFGIISFSAKKSGSGKIMIDDYSTSFNIDKNTTPVGNDISVAVSRGPDRTTVQTTQTSTTTTFEDVTPDTQIDQFSQTAAVSDSIDNMSVFNNFWLWFLIVAIAIVIILGIIIFIKK